MSLTRLIRPAAALAVGIMAFGVVGAQPALAAPKPRLPITLTQQPANPSSNNAPGFAWTTVLGAAYTCALDGAAATSCDSSRSYTGLLDGSHTFVLKGKLSGAYRPGTKIVSWVVDTLPPGAPTVAPVASPTSTTSAVISFTNADPSAVAHTCALDGAPAADCTSPWTVGSLAEGPHTVVVRSKDEHGVLGGFAPVSWIVDLTAPENVLLSGPTSPTNSSTASFTFSAGGASAYACSLDGAAAVTCASPYVVNGISDGPHAMTVSASDGAGNVAQPAVALWTVDTAAPATPTFLTGPASPTNQPVADFVVGNQDGSSTLQCRLDSTSPGDWLTCPSPLHYAGLAEAVHSLDVRAVDAAGNASTVATKAWTVDLTAPTPAQIVSGPLSPSNQPLPSFDFVATDGSTTGFECALDGGPFVVCDIDTVPLGSGVGEGSHVLQVRVLDSANNPSAPASWTWTVDLTAPAAPGFSTKPATSTTDTTAVFAFSSEPGATFSCSLDGATPAACASPVSLTGVGVGAHTFVVTAEDAARNSSQSSHGWTVTAPTPPASTPPASTPPASNPPASTPPPAAASPATTATLTTSRALTGRSTVAFSADVRGVSASSVLIQPAPGGTVTVSLACATAGGSATACTSTSVRSVTVTPTKALVPGQTYTLTVHGVSDASGRAVTGSASFRASTDEQETSPAAGYRWRVASAAKAYGRSYLVEDRKGASVTYAFTGTKVTWFTMTGPSQGRATVFVDGVRKARVNNWSAATAWRVARTVTGLKPGTHRLRVVVAGTKGATAGTGTNVAFDAAKVAKRVVATPATTTAWRHATATAASGKAYAVARVAGATASFTFRGRSVSWATQTGPAMGKAKVYVDGVLKATVDNYAKRGAWNVRRTVAGLTDASHTVKVVVTGGKRRASTGTDVVVDRWLVG